MLGIKIGPFTVIICRSVWDGDVSEPDSDSAPEVPANVLTWNTATVTLDAEYVVFNAA